MATPPPASPQNDWYYYDNDTAERFGPVSKAQLQSFAQNGSITQNTLLETASGHKGRAEQLQWLTFPPQPPSHIQPPAPPAQPTAPRQSIVNIPAKPIQNTDFPVAKKEKVLELFREYRKIPQHKGVAALQGLVSYENIDLCDEAAADGKMAEGLLLWGTLSFANGLAGVASSHNDGIDAPEAKKRNA